MIGWQFPLCIVYVASCSKQMQHLINCCKMKAAITVLSPPMNSCKVPTYSVYCSHNLAAAVGHFPARNAIHLSKHSSNLISLAISETSFIDHGFSVPHQHQASALKKCLCLILVDFDRGSMVISPEVLWSFPFYQTMVGFLFLTW